MSGRRDSFAPGRSTTNSAVTCQALFSGRSQSMYRRGKLLVSPRIVCGRLLPSVSRSYTFSLVRTSPSNTTSLIACTAAWMFPSENA